ncbi:hypothetical protein JOC27_000469 [Sporolactobacillus spathodeae]|uniref:Uncharacterized protein n=1 Tax=Sporolactobacillus spathodeae TaxID=1465502 RepID=A0ABS2Q5N0_9BACL|nr:hypothetical protein [Sporolactobacillus spathodeae]
MDEKVIFLIIEPLATYAGRFFCALDTFMTLLRGADRFLSINP